MPIMRITRFVKKGLFQAVFFGERVGSPSTHGYHVMVSHRDTTLVREINASLNRGEPYEGSFSSDNVHSLNPTARMNRLASEKDFGSEDYE